MISGIITRRGNLGATVARQGEDGNGRAMVMTRGHLRRGGTFLLTLLVIGFGPARGEEPEIVAVDLQPLKANVRRLVEALEFLGTPLPRASADALERAGDAAEVQRLVDPGVHLIVALNPESRVKVRRGPAPAVLQQAGYTPV